TSEIVTSQLCSSARAVATDSGGGPSACAFFPKDTSLEISAPFTPPSATINPTTPTTTPTFRMAQPRCKRSAVYARGALTLHGESRLIVHVRHAPSSLVVVLVCFACGEAAIPPAPPTVREPRVESVAPAPTCAPRVDRDGDGILDACDQCPDQGAQ